ncbi:hypothetical protein A2U01_0033587, partial [Trifolium medium]|nr:hypothetical protein [Trifolium medium]
FILVSDLERWRKSAVIACCGLCRKPLSEWRAAPCCGIELVKASAIGAWRGECWRVTQGCKEIGQGRSVSGAWRRIMWRVAQVHMARGALFVNWPARSVADLARGASRFSI